MDLTVEQRIEQVERQARRQVGTAADVERDEAIASVSFYGSMAVGAGIAAKGGWVGLAAYGAAMGGGFAGSWLAEATGADELAADAMEAFGMRRVGGGGPHPARATDQVAHSFAFGGFLASIVVGALAAVAVGALIVATGGVAAVAVIGAAAAGGFVGGFLGSAVGKAAAGMGIRTGPITSGSLDVFIEGLPAARMTDVAACGKESAPQPIVEGSQTIFVNGLPLARVGHKLLCGALIDQGASSVFLDETTVACAQPAPDIPIWARVAADWVGFLPVGRVAARLGSRTRSAAAAGRSQRNVRCAADPVDVATGAFVDWRCDIDIPGALPVQWRRHYTSARAPPGGVSLHGGSWLDNWSVQLRRSQGNARTIDYHDDEGVVYTFWLGDAGPDTPLNAEHVRAPHLVLRGTAEAPELWDRTSGIRAHFAWDGDTAQLTAWSDASGNRCMFVRDTSPRGRRLSRLQHSDGWSLLLQWHDDDTGAPSRVGSIWLEDPGRPVIELVRMAHDRQGRLIHCASTASGRLRYTYDGAGRLCAWGDDNATRVHIDYDAQGRVSRMLSSGHLHSARFEYLPAERLTRVRRLLSYTDETAADDELPCEQYHYNADALVTHERDALGRTRQTEWDHSHRVLATTDAIGRRTLYEYDDAGRLAAIVDHREGRSRFSYDDEGRLIGATDAHGRRTEITYDEAGRIASHSEAGRTVRVDYTARGHPLRLHQPDGGTTQYHYDEAHRQCGRTDPNGAHTAWRQDRLGRLDWLTDALGATTTYDYPPSGHQAEPSIEPPRANVHTQAERIVLPGGNTIRQTFNSEGLIAEYTDAAGHTQHWRWGAFDLLTEHIDAAGQSTRYHWSGSAGLLGGDEPQLTQLVDAAGHAWQWRYDDAGNLVEQTDAAGRVTGWQHDPVGRPLVRRLPDGSEWRYKWDAADQLLSIGTPDVRQGFRYDEKDRLVQAQVWRAAAASSEPERCDSDLRLEYDDADQLIAETHRLGEATEARRIGYRYDELGRRTVREGPLGPSHYTYDALGLPRELHTAYGTVHITRDALGREVERASVAAQAPPASGAAPPHPHFRLHQRYDALGQLVLQRVPGTATNRADSVHRAYHWHQMRLTGLDDARFGEVRWQLDAREQIVQAIRRAARKQPVPGHGSSLSRDPYEDPPASGDEQHFGYDSVGNLARIDGHRLHIEKDVVTQAGANRYEWDARGRLVRRTMQRDGFRPQTWRYGWDGLNRLIDVYTPDSRHWRYGYDAFGRRRAKALVSGPVASNGQQRRAGACRAEYLWDGAAVAAQWRVYSDGTSQSPTGRAGGLEQVQEWHYQEDSFNPLAVVQRRGDEAGAILYHVVADINGAPRELISNEGEVVWAGELDTWGRLRRCDVRDRDGHRTAANDALIDVDLRFANQWADEESGLVYNLNRHYDPGLGSYVSQDPLGPVGGIRTHGYVDNPLTWIDPLGLAECPHPDALPQGVEPYQLELFPRERYNRVQHYGNTPTRAQRASVPAGMEFDHNPTLVQHYWEGPGPGRLAGHNLTPAERRAFGASLAHGGPAAPAAQRSQGAGAARYSRGRNRRFGL